MPRGVAAVLGALHLDEPDLAGADEHEVGEAQGAARLAGVALADDGEERRHCLGGLAATFTKDASGPALMASPLGRPSRGTASLLTRPPT